MECMVMVTNYILEKIDDNNYSLKFIEEEKTILLKLDGETNMLNEI